MEKHKTILLYLKMWGYSLLNKVAIRALFLMEKRMGKDFMSQQTEK